VPYHDIAVPKATFPVTRIMFGPGFHETTEKKALRHLRDRCKLGDIPIEKTNLSYRAD
jgi:hypothetical protein